VQLAEEVVTFVRGGVAVIVASRDDELRPQVGRGWGTEISADGESVTLCIGAPPDSPMRANLQHGRGIAATFTLPTSYRGVQIKGDVLELGEPTAQQLARVGEHLEAFARETEQVGLTRELARRLIDPVLLAVTFSARELYDQTPGASAGVRL
jgi:hypothetical protein